MHRPSLRLEALSDDDLLSRLAEVASRTRRTEAELVWHLAEVDARRLYLREACPSMHVYATARLHMSDAEAYLRINVARISRRFPVVLAMLADGRLHLSAVARLGPLLREGNGEALLARAVHKSRREIDLLVAELAPRPDVPSRIRRLPAVAERATAVEAVAVELRPDGVQNRQVGEAPPAAGIDLAVPVAATGTLGPIAPARFKVQFTAGAELHDKITRCQALLRHVVPDGDLAAVFDRAMTLLVQELEQVRFAATSRPRKSASEADPTPSSRRIPDPIRRAVWSRDGGQCTFRDRAGRRCPSLERLEFHHVVPFARGGDHRESNVTLSALVTTLLKPRSTSALSSWRRGVVRLGGFVLGLGLGRMVETGCPTVG